MQRSTCSHPHLNTASFDSMKGTAMARQGPWRSHSTNWADLPPHTAVGSDDQGFLNTPSTTFPRDADVMILVGKNRKAYHISAESLRRGSSYFRARLAELQPNTVSSRGGAVDTCKMVVDCEERIFEHMMSVMRYGTMEALPADLAESDTLKLRKELQQYGIHYDPDSGRCCAAADAPLPDSPNSCSSSGSHGPAPSSSSSSASSSSGVSPSGSPKWGAARQAPHAPFGFSTGARKSSGISRRPPSRLSQLPNFPPSLADSAKLVLVSCEPGSMSEDTICHFCCSGGSGSSTPNQWALNFAQRHAFCVGCGRAPLQMPAKLFAEMFMAATSYYLLAHDEDAASVAKQSPRSVAATMSRSRKWVVSSDSTCTLRFVEGPCCPRCATSPRTPESCRSPEEDGALWAASAYFGHAFCSSCGEAAAGPTLLSLLLALRYGKVRHVPSQ